MRLGFIAPGIVRSVMVAVCVCYTASYKILEEETACIVWLPTKSAKP